MNIKTKLSHRSNYGNIRNTSQIKYIVIHYTGVDGDSDENSGKYFAREITKTSAHYFVDADSITQTVPDNYVAYSVGGNKYSDCVKTGGGKFHKKCTNTNSLSIEICDGLKDGIIYPSAAIIANVLELTKAKMKEYGIPKENVIRHFDVTGKKCPLYWVDDTKWCNEFWNKLNTELTSANDITWELNNSYFPISDMKKFVTELEEARKNNSSLYWGYYKLVNKIKST